MNDASPCPPHKPPAAAELILRAVRPDDAEAITRLANLPGYRAGTLRQPFQRIDVTRKWLDALPADGLHIVAELRGEVIGNAGIDRHQGRRRHTAGIGMGVHDDHVGQGVGSALLAALVDAADHWLDIVRLELTVFTDNTPAIRLYERFGFEREGLHRAFAFRNGAYADVFAMARLRPDWAKSADSHP
ncbi:GNAT family N-acetyltransferase [Oryzibacter oryziterrae]|uniref:GNAT family N-acetyltransferase n=1 Tax=Oryzibacter oryziterrae TaxID=2766474 RepID=UPI001F00B601|nr:GNAT family N-acetyltransferase [Oryzibacter oryziterrae]